MATDESVRAKELLTRDRGQLGNWLFTGYGDREEKTPIAVSVPKVGASRGPKVGPPSTAGPDAAAAASPGLHQRSGSAEARVYQARNRGNIGDIMGMHEDAAPPLPPSPTESRASTAMSEALSDMPSEAKSSPAKSSSSGSERASVVAASEAGDFPSPTRSRVESVAASVAPSEAGDAPDARPRSVAEQYAKRNKGTMDNTFGESSPRALMTPRVKGTDAQAYATRNRGQLTSDQYNYGQGGREPVVTGRPMSAKRQQDNMAGILGSAPAGRDARDSAPQVRSPRNAEARLYKDRNRGTMGDVLGGGGPWEMPAKSLAHDSYN